MATASKPFPMQVEQYLTASTACCESINFRKKDIKNTLNEHLSKNERLRGLLDFSMTEIQSATKRLAFHSSISIFEAPDGNCKDWPFFGYAEEEILLLCSMLSFLHYRVYMSDFSCEDEASKASIMIDWKTDDGDARSISEAGKWYCLYLKIKLNQFTGYCAPFFNKSGG